MRQLPGDRLNRRSGHHAPRAAALVSALVTAVCPTSRNHTLRRAAVVPAAKGGMLAGITAGDVLELLDTEAGVHGAVRSDGAACYRLLRKMGIFGPPPPARLRELRTAGQRTPAELIDRQQLACQPIP